MEFPLPKWPLILIICLFSLVQCHEEQQALLLSFKQSLSYDSLLSMKLSQWNSSTNDCCYWAGVTCKEGRVIGLDLSNESISSTMLPNLSSLFALNHLESLNLAVNDFNSVPITAGIGKLFRLVHLNLSDSNFGGEIPLEISNLTRLETLDLSFNYYSLYLKAEKPSLKMVLQSLTKLTELRLEQVDLSAEGNEWCHALSPNLRVLRLSECSISSPIDSCFEKFRSIEVIRLSSNPLSGPVPKFFSNFSHLTSLHLFDCDLYGEFPKEVFLMPSLEFVGLSGNSLLSGNFPEFPPNASLRTLLLRRTNFSGELPASFGNLQMLSMLYLDFSNFTGKIPHSISNLRRLVHVDLSSNEFTGEIPASLFSLPLLEDISLSNNQFNGQLPEIPDASLSLLYALDLSKNELDGSLPVSLFELGRLKTLDLSSNNFTGTVQLHMFQKLEALAHLDLSYNNLSVDVNGTRNSTFGFVGLKLASCKLRTFPDFLRNKSTSIQYLDLSDNQISGLIPNWIWKEELEHLNLSHNLLVTLQQPIQMPHIGILDLHSNQLEGHIPIPPSFVYLDYSNNNLTFSIPADIGNISSSFYFFSLSNNKVFGEIPSSLCDSYRLLFLDLSYNGLTGTIPSCLIGKSNTLRLLNLRNNNLSGPIPDAFPVGCSLETLDLNANLIERKIPESLTHCNRLEVLDIGKNNLIGEFPCSLKNISTLRVLVLRSNKFHGNIGCPNANKSWEMLQIIDIAHNKFGGRLSSGIFRKWKAMMSREDNRATLNHLQVEVELYSIYYQDSVTVTMKGLDLQLEKILTVYNCIDFSGNYFFGPIPEEIGELKELYVLNFSNNAFIGSIPTSLGNLRRLESLDVSRNKLNGTIPTSLANLNFLSFLNLSYNQLVGRIPSGSQLQTFSADSFTGNEGLCGFPLTKNCTDGEVPDTPNDDHLHSESEIDWNFLSAEIGFVVGFGIVIGSLMFYKRWRIFYFQTTEEIAFRIFPLAVTRKWLEWTKTR